MSSSSGPAGDRQIVDEAIRPAAIRQLREVYETIYRNGRLPLSTLNHGFDETTRYQHRDQYLRVAFEAAAEIGNFAGRVGVLTSSDQLAIMYEFFDNHPEYVEMGWGPGPDERPRKPGPSGAY